MQASFAAIDRRQAARFAGYLLKSPDNRHHYSSIVEGVQVARDQAVRTGRRLKPAAGNVCGPVEKAILLYGLYVIMLQWRRSYFCAEVLATRSVTF
jgi:hypothetical protein